MSFFLKKTAEVAFLHVFEGLQTDEVKNAGSDDEKRKIYETILGRGLADVDSASVPHFLTQDELDHITKSYLADVGTRVSFMLNTISHTHLVNSEQLAELAIKSLVKRYRKYMSSTGIVIAGYGDRNHFPSLNEYRCYGILLDKVVYEDGNVYVINRDKVAEIVAFASTAMVETFTTGISPDAFAHASMAFEKCANKLAEAIKAETGLAEIPDLQARVNDLRQEFTRHWYWPCLEAHHDPLRRVVAMLPLDEMAELGETLINLESLKEKVTQPTQSVGGPVDVAVISKNDGFVWIKRKHYFSAELNPRFFARRNGR